MDKLEINLNSFSQVDDNKLYNFLTTAFGKDKAEFLKNYYMWWYNGDNAIIATANNEVAGFCGIIPDRIKAGKEIINAAWWVDLYVHPKFRGLGIQRLLNNKVLEKYPNIFGFPNKVASLIHKKHGWLILNNCNIYLFPVIFEEISPIKKINSKYKFLIPILSILTKPIIFYFINKLKQKGNRTILIDNVDLNVLSSCYDKLSEINIITTHRDHQYLKRKYIHSPFAHQLKYFIAGTEDDSQLILIMRLLDHKQPIIARIIDLIGNINNYKLLEDVIIAATKYAISRGAVQITIATSYPLIKNILLNSGYFINKTFRFCFFVRDNQLKEIINKYPHHWVLADSDNETLY